MQLAGRAHMLSLCVHYDLYANLEAGAAAVPVALGPPKVKREAGHEEGDLEDVDGQDADGGGQAERAKPWNQVHEPQAGKK